MMLTVMFPVFFRTKHYTFALWSREVPRLLPDIDPQGGVVPQELFPIFFQELASVFSPKPIMMFRRLLTAGLFFS